MKAINLLLLSLLVALGAVVWIVLTPEPMGATGAAHPTIDGMRIAPEGAARYEAVATPVFILQIAVLVAMTSLLLLPFRTPIRQHSMRIRLMLVLVLSASVWIGITEAYEHFISVPGGMDDLSFFAGFPLPSALAVYAVWGVGLLLTYFYVVGFDRFIYTPKDREGFEALLREQRVEDT